MTDAELMESPAFQVAMAVKAVVVGTDDLRKLAREQPDLVRAEVPDLDLACRALSRILYDTGRKQKCA